MTNALTMTSGTWDASTYTHNIAGNWNSTAITFTPNFSTVRLTTTPSPTITTNGLGQPFYNLVLYQGATAASAIQVNNDLTVAATGAGILSLTGWPLTVGRDLTRTNTSTLTAGGGQTITVGRDWNVSTFNAGTSTVNFNTAQTATIRSSNAFNIFSCTTGGKIIQFTAGTTTGVGTNFAITGASGNQIWLISTVLKFSMVNRSQC